MAKQVLFSTQAAGHSFIVFAEGRVSPIIFVVHSGTGDWDIDIHVDGGFRRIETITGTYHVRTDMAHGGRYRVDPATTGREIFAIARDRGTIISVNPTTSAAARTLAQETGDVDTVDVSGDFAIDYDPYPRLTYTVASADTAVATATVDQEGVVTITAVTAGSSVVTVTITDRHGRTATQTITTTVTAP